ncbi:MAG: membrane protein FxsA [Candidatus Omnitrophica bacterium]|nr:membrane protein FxsA [Candidatus Omnitrophota bacterium]MDD5355989.1 membrane protein FxsA [Candidatus Omnitrophota bacterium]
MFFYLALLFIIVPTLELYLLIKVGQHIGALNTVMIVIWTGILGALLAKMEGLKVLYSVQMDLQEGKMPASKLLDGLLILIGAVLLITPGLLTDIMGLILIIPFTRIFVKIWLKWKLKAMVDRKQGFINLKGYRYDE